MLRLFDGLGRIDPSSDNPRNREVGDSGEVVKVNYFSRGKAISAQPLSVEDGKRAAQAEVIGVEKLLRFFVVSAFWVPGELTELFVKLIGDGGIAREGRVRKNYPKALVPGGESPKGNGCRYQGPAPQTGRHNAGKACAGLDILDECLNVVHKSDTFG